MPLHTGNIIADKSYDYANRIVKAYKFLKFKHNGTSFVDHSYTKSLCICVC